MGGLESDQKDCKLTSSTQCHGDLTNENINAEILTRVSTSKYFVRT